MYWQFSSYSLFNFLIAGLTASVAVVGWRRRQVTGGLPLFWLMTAVSWWMFAYGLETAAVNLQDKIFWAKIQYFGVHSCHVFLLLFAIQFAECERLLTARSQFLLWLMPLLTISLALSNEYHHLIWTGFAPVEGTNLVIFEHGPGFWVATAYIYLVVIASAFILLRASLSRRNIFRYQVLAILIGMAFPWGGNILYLSGFGTPGFDFTSIGFAIIGILLLWSIQNTKLLDLIPVARSTLIDTMADAMVVLDEQTRLVDINPAAEKIVGRQAGDVIGLPAEQIFKFQPQLVDALGALTKTKLETAVTCDNTTRHYDLNISPLRNNRQQITGRVLVWRDITDRQKVKEALYQSNQELGARNADLDAFSYMVAHNLKNPVATLQGLADLLNDSRTTTEQYQEYIGEIGKIGSKMNNIIDELMLLAGLGQTNVKMGPVDMAGVIVKVEMRLAQLIQQTGGQLHYLPDWPLALGHTPWVEEALVNYTSNALKYGGCPPIVQLGALCLSGNRVRYWVRDNGPGLQPEEQVRLFTKFERLGQTKATGHGLGLTVVRRIMEKMGGDYGVESTAVPGEGCTFYITLPGFSPENPKIDS
jgi:PAS domain S-box-containing protein